MKIYILDSVGDKKAIAGGNIVKPFCFHSLIVSYKNNLEMVEILCKHVLTTLV